MEFDVFNNPHPHPLILYQHGKPDGSNVLCSKCHEPWRPPAFGCPDCNFHIHVSCIVHPHEIRTPFHPQHSLYLKHAGNGNDSCRLCAHKSYGNMYRCDICDIQIDVQCAIADTKASGIQRTAGGEFRHFAHPHPLILQSDQQRLQHRGIRFVFCFLCKGHIESGSSYFCPTCDSHVHQDCAHLPREILKLDSHSHPLFSIYSDRLTLYCQSCRNGFTGFSYGCLSCKFYLHVACVPLLKHQHQFIRFRKVRFDCQVCNSSDNIGFPWKCKTCQLLAHEECLELPSTDLYVSEHDHPLTLTFPCSHEIYRCKICLQSIEAPYVYAIYVCSQCKYVAHLDCAKYLRTDNEEQDAIDPFGNPKKEETQIQENGVMRHFSHKHDLSLCSGEDRHCDGCMRRISTLSQSYGCSQCRFYLHQECAILPRRLKNPLLHLHELSMLYIPDFVFSCPICLQYFHGFAYYCKECHCTIDIRCAAVSFPLKHSNHKHPLFKINERMQGREFCSACGESLQDKDGYFRSKEFRRSFLLDFKCAHLPLAVRNRFDEHPLSLTFRRKDCHKNEYYCDICEDDQREVGKKEWFYSCKLCCFYAHINCVLGDYPFLKSAQFQGHRHPLSLVEHGNQGRSACGQCGESCQGQLAFQCEDVTCNFTVHAFGLCYHNQLTQAPITFIMPSLCYRSIPLYSNIPQNQKKGSNLIIPFDDAKEEVDDRRKLAMSLRRYGGGTGKLWDDRVFSSIKRMVIAHGEYIHSIQTEYYDDNGSLTWSDRHGGNGGLTSEVELEDPAECLISIHGCMGDFDGHYMVRSLVLESNKRIYGPFGKEEGTRFCFPITGATIVGFHGTSTHCLESIGIKVEPLTRTSKTTILE